MLDLFSLNHSSRIETIRSLVEIVAIILAGIWVFYEFIYINKIVPANEPALINVISEVESTKFKSDMVAITIKLSLHNESQFNLDNIVSFFNVKGYKVNRKENDNYSDVVSEFDASTGKFSTSRGFYLLECKGIASGIVLYNEWTVRKNSKLKDSIVLIVPNDLDYIRVYFTFFFQPENGKFEVDYWEGPYGEVWPNFRVRNDGIFSKWFDLPPEYDEYINTLNEDELLLDLMESYSVFWKDSVLEVSLWRKDSSSQAAKWCKYPSTALCRSLFPPIRTLTYPDYGSGYIKLLP